jgi:hypothetical protein
MLALFFVESGIWESLSHCHTVTLSRDRAHKPTGKDFATALLIAAKIPRRNDRSACNSRVDNALAQRGALRLNFTETVPCEWRRYTHAGGSDPGRFPPLGRTRDLDGPCRGQLPSAMMAPTRGRAIQECCLLFGSPETALEELHRATIISPVFSSASAPFARPKSRTTYKFCNKSFDQ